MATMSDHKRLCHYCCSSIILEKSPLCPFYMLPIVCLMTDVLKEYLPYNCVLGYMFINIILQLISPDNHQTVRELTKYYSSITPAAQLQNFYDLFQPCDSQPQTISTPFKGVLSHIRVDSPIFFKDESISE